LCAGLGEHHGGAAGRGGESGGPQDEAGVGADASAGKARETPGARRAKLERALGSLFPDGGGGGRGGEGETSNPKP